MRESCPGIAGKPLKLTTFANFVWHVPISLAHPGDTTNASLLATAVNSAPVSVSAPLIAYAGLDDATPWIAPVVTPAPETDWHVWGDALWLIAAVYIGMAIFGVGRLGLAYMRLYWIVRDAQPAGHFGKGVRLTTAIVPAFAAGPATVILPASLIDKLSPEQVRLVIAHEHTHLDRGDSLYFALLSWIDALFWFNPCLRRQTARARLAAELACDDAVTRYRPDQRQAYATALLLALKQSAGDVRQYAPAVISSSTSGDFRMRLTEIMHASDRQRKARWLAPALTALLILPIAGLQLAWAQGKAPQIVPDKPAQSAATIIKPDTLFTVMPTAGKLVSGYGMRDNPVTGKYTLHDGVDISQAIGTPVYAPAAGHVTRADEAQPGYGKVLEIDHGSGLVTRYMHLGDFAVAVGDTVQAGQLIAKSGNTGRSTGPHTHIGVFKDGKAIDPATVMPLPGQ